LGASKRFYYSDDLGKRWLKETLPNDLFASKLAYSDNGQVWAYSLSGDFQKRN
jgi:hypothetical protein